MLRPGTSLNLDSGLGYCCQLDKPESGCEKLCNFAKYRKREPTGGPAGLDDVSMLPALTAGLIERGHSPETVVKVLGENLLRVMEANERVATEPRRTVSE